MFDYQHCQQRRQGSPARTYGSVSVGVRMIESIIVVSVLWYWLPCFASFLDHVIKTFRICSISCAAASDSNHSDGDRLIELSLTVIVLSKLGDHV